MDKKLEKNLDDTLPDENRSEASTSDEKDLMLLALESNNFSFDEIRQKVSVVLKEKFGSNMNDELSYVWIVDMYDDYCIYEKGLEDYFKVSYVLEDSGEVTLGDSKEVIREIVYRPVSAEAAKRKPKPKGKWEDIPAQLMGDPKNNAFPLDTESRANAAIRYLVKYFNNPSDKGVTAGYSEADFKKVHNKIVKVMKNKYHIEHGGCDICQKNRKGAASLDENKEEKTKAEEPKVDDSVIASLTEEIKSLKDAKASDEATIKELTEKVATYAAKEKLDTRKATLASKGVEISEEKMEALANLEDSAFDLFVELMPEKAEASEEEEKNEKETDKTEASKKEEESEKKLTPEEVAQAKASINLENTEKSLVEKFIEMQR
ncbi:MAG: hypothetical protein WC476_01110 [Phycisphaerae bacterium]